ncbi:MAG: NADH-quinone oxidoreductase subunit C [Candidatus Eremiobacteraeota bacterium]|nr:NADH-quinone oxidoreductase subunit C [Candidatus Eremiobacteraeota bacterium]
MEEIEKENGRNSSVAMDCDLDQFEVTIKKLKEIDADFLTLSIHREDEDKLSLLYYFRHERRILVVNVKTKEKLIPSLYSHFARADLIEREIFKIFGIKFLGHPNLDALSMNNPSDGNMPSTNEIPE